VCLLLQFKGGVTAKALKIWALVEERSHRIISNAVIGHYSLQKKCTYKKTAPALGNGAAAKEQGEASAAAWRIIFPQVHEVCSSWWRARAGKCLETQPSYKTTRS